MSNESLKKSIIDYYDLLNIPFKKGISIIHSADFIPQNDSNNNTTPIIVTDENDTKKSYGFAHLNHINHFVNENRADFINELNFSAAVQQNPEQFFKDPAKTVFQFKDNSNSNELYKREYNSNNEKPTILDEVDTVSDQNNFPNSTKGITRCILDELFTNTIYNAPFMDFENNNSGASRSNNDIILPEGKMSEVFLATNSSEILIGCRDPFGTLNLDYIKKKIFNCYKNGVSNSMNKENTGGAGIGTYMVIESSCTYFAATNKGRETIVATAIPLKMSNIKRTEHPKNYHFINIKEGEN